MNNQRPNPDELLTRVRANEAQQARGKLKIFFGAAAGVGKTFAMLESAHERRAEGIDVVVGYVETHGRVETEALLKGLEVLPRRAFIHRGTRLYEFDLDAMLKRRPTLALVDELAHINVPGARHARRWQDIEELLDVGIDVYTTVNVQHLESLNDVVAQITGVVVRETVPDRILAMADEIELIDLPPGELLQRLKEGKVYVSEQADLAARNFFRKGNLIALRELALRHLAARVDIQMQTYKRDHAITQTWPATDRILVCVGPGPFSTRLVRAACRMATGLRAEWLAVHVEAPTFRRISQADREQLMQTMRLAEQLGAEAVTLSGQRVSEEIVAYARSRNVSKIVIGKPSHPRWRKLLFGSIVDDVVRRSGEIDVYVITGDTPTTPTPTYPHLVPTGNWLAYGWGLLTVVVCTMLAWLMYPYFELVNLIMIYLLGVAVIATRVGRGASIMASILSVAAFDFFFIEPRYTLLVDDLQFLLTFVIMLVVGLLISTLTVRVCQQAETACQRERRMAALYGLSRELASKRGLKNLPRIAVRHIAEVFDSQTVILLPDHNGQLTVQAGEADRFQFDASERQVAQWVYDHRQTAGLGTNTLSGSKGLYFPLTASQRTVGVLGVRPAQPERVLSTEQFHLLETFANQTALAIERALLAEDAQHARIQVETERLRNTLLSSVSHDLHTPLATITSAASTLLEGEQPIDMTTRHDIVRVIYEEADRLNRLLSNLLDMTRLESGAIKIKKEWQALEEIVSAALNRLERYLNDHPVTIQFAPDLPLVPVDGMMIEQVFINLLENVIKYTAGGSSIDISARATDNEVIVDVADRGPGFLPEDVEQIFDKFYRAQPSAHGGAGLGLAICRAIIEAHGGRIWAENRPGGGAVFCFTLPVGEAPPIVDIEAAVIEKAPDG